MNIEYTDDEVIPIKELVHLYESADWLLIAADPDALARAVDNSTYVVTARDDEGNLIGLSRCLSDDVSIMYLQEIVVSTTHQRRGVGRALADFCFAKYGHVTKLIACTSSDPSTSLFCQSLGFRQLGSPRPGELAAFIHDSAGQHG